MNFFITLQEHALRDQFFPEPALERLRSMGQVRFNELGRTMTEEELADSLEDVDVCLTHSWLGCPVFNEVSLRNAPRLKMIAHVCASVGMVVTDAVYDRGIKVSSANKIMARYVAEAALAYILSALKQIPLHDRSMKNGLWNNYGNASLIGKRISLIGLGTIGRFLLEMLRPFEVSVRIFDPYIDPAELRSYPEAELIPSLREALEWGDIVSLHASKTPETYHMLDREMLGHIRDGALLINTSRGALIDEAALADELSSGRFGAVLDVYEKEPLPADSRLRGLENVILMPHSAGHIDYAGYTFGIIEEIRRLLAGEPLQLEISRKQFKLMTV